MVDKFTVEKRSQIMSRVSGKDTKPEIIVRKKLHGMGYRYRLHRADLPGKPDIVLPKHKKIIIVNGCFWHGHEGCRRSKRPTTNIAFWEKKLDSNLARDRANSAALQSAGWQLLVIWECQTRNQDDLHTRLLSFLRPS